MKITQQVWEFSEPVVQAHGCSLWDVEYIREGGEWFLRLYIDKEGGVNISDCEAISRAIDPILDEKDPIPDSSAPPGWSASSSARPILNGSWAAPSPSGSTPRRTEPKSTPAS